VSGPLVYVGKHAIQEGKLEVAREASRDLAEHLEANHPREAHFEISIDDSLREMTVLQVHPDEESLQLHIQIGADRIEAAYEFLEGTTSIEIYGDPTDDLRGMLNAMSAGAPIRVHSPDAGFSRLAQTSA
jgi:hypothetical protein